MRFLLFEFTLIAALQLSIKALLVRLPAATFNSNFANPSAFCLKQNRIWKRNAESRLMESANGINEDTIASLTVDAIPAVAPSASVPFVQDNPRQGKIYRSYQEFVTYVMKTPLWRDYSLSLTMKPVITKASSSMIGYFLGDLLAQLIFRKGGFDFARFLRMGAFGGLFHGPTGHLFYGLLERRFPGASTSAVVKKVTVDQLVWCPIFTLALFTFTGITAGLSPRETFAALKISGPQAILSSWLIWPAAHAVNFRVIPGRQRLLYINIIQLFFNAILSALANSVI